MQEMVVRSLGQNQKLVSASFAKLQFWTERKRVLKGGLQVGKISGSLEINKVRLQYKSPNWTRMQKRLIHSNFPRDITGFLLEDEWYASTDISKHLEEFLKKYLNGL